MPHNPLTAAILKLLEDAPDGLSEFEIITRLKNLGLYIDDLEDPSMTLFTGHFLVMNALYTLQRDLAAESVFLQVSPLENRLCRSRDSTSGQLQREPTDAALSAYYLDWRNLETMSSAGVSALLNDFWERFLAEDQEDEALRVLGLAPGSEWEAIQLGYRRLAAAHHPDKGGDGQAFIRIREAYETLRIIHQ